MSLPANYWRICFSGFAVFVSRNTHYIIPELMEGMGLMHHNKPVDVLEHNMLT